MIRVTGNNSLLMSSLNTDTDNDTKVVDLLKKSSETEKSSKTTGKKSEEYEHEPAVRTVSQYTFPKSTT